MNDESPFEGWAIVELMGHRRLAGHVTEQQVAGAGMLRVDMPNGCTGIAASHCPVHGDCKCAERGEVSPRSWDDPACPLHSPVSDHGEGWAATQFYSPAAVYCITPTTEDVARSVAVDHRPQPATRWELNRVRDDEEPF